MKPKLTLSLFAAIAFVAYGCPISARAQTSSNSQPANTSGQTGSSQANNNWNSAQNSQTGNNHWQQGANSNGNSASAHRMAMKMVPAEANLTQTLDAKNAHPGEQIRARLQDSVQLKNGPELPKGTVLLGKVSNDHVKPDNVRLAVCFNQAKLNDGKTIPIKATVVGIAPPQNSTAPNGTVQTGNVGYAALWTPNTLQVDQVNVMSGVDLHSRIHSSNSAVFVSHTRNDVKLHAGSQLALAISERSQNPNPASAPGM